MIIRISGQPEGWTGPVQRETSVAEVQAIADEYGGMREKRDRVHRIKCISGVPNVASAHAKSSPFGADTFLFQWAWRPFYTPRSHVSRELFERHHGLFICG